MDKSQQAQRNLEQARLDGRLDPVYSIKPTENGYMASQEVKSIDLGHGYMTTPFYQGRKFDTKVEARAWIEEIKKDEDDD